MPTLKRWGAMAGVWMIAASAWAHVPYLEEQDLTANNPFGCPSARQSMAVYSWLESKTDVDFYTFTVYARTPFLAEVIVPVFDVYAEFRPSLALIGPGLPLPTEPLPITLAPGYGAIVLHDSGGQPRPQFYEPFGGKSYYQGPHMEPTLNPGKYTLIYWDPAGNLGDYTAVIGKYEIWYPKDVRQALRITPIIRAGGELHLP